MLKDGQTYAGRRADVVVINASISREAAAVLRVYSPPGRKALGRFLERLLYEHHAREGEKQRISEALSVIMSKN